MARKMYDAPMRAVTWLDDLLDRAMEQAWPFLLLGAGLFLLIAVIRSW